MNFFESVRVCFCKYFDFTGRARRSEHWWFQLFCVLGILLLGFLDEAIFGAEVWPGDMASSSGSNLISFLWGKDHFSNIFSYGTLIPSVAVTARRFHDIGLSGWHSLILYLMPFMFGFFIFIKSDAIFIISVLLGLVIIGVYIYHLAKDSEKLENQYGLNPKRISV